MDDLHLPNDGVDTRSMIRPDVPEQGLAYESQDLPTPVITRRDVITTLGFAVLASATFSSQAAQADKKADKKAAKAKRKKPRKKPTKKEERKLAAEEERKKTYGLARQLGFMSIENKEDLTLKFDLDEPGPYSFLKLRFNEKASEIIKEFCYEGDDKPYNIKKFPVTKDNFESLLRNSYGSGFKVDVVSK